MERGNSNEHPQQMFLRINKQHHPLIITKYTPYLFHCLQAQLDLEEHQKSMFALTVFKRLPSETLTILVTQPVETAFNFNVYFLIQSALQSPYCEHNQTGDAAVAENSQ